MNLDSSSKFCQITIFNFFVLMKYFEHVEEAVWAVEVLKETGLPVAASLCIGPDGDLHGVPTGECAVRLVNAGEDLV